MNNSNHHGSIGFWKSVGEVRPANDERVLVYDPDWYGNSKCLVAIYRADGGYFDVIPDNGGWDTCKTATHWARFEPPTERVVSELEDRLEWAFNGKRGD